MAKRERFVTFATSIVDNVNMLIAANKWNTIKIRLPRLIINMPYGSNFMTILDVFISHWKKNGGLDPLPTSLLKDCIEFLVKTITRLVNASCFPGVFPSAFKHGRVTPVLKKKGLDPKAFKNYPSITKLPFLSKVVEKCALSQMYSYLLHNDLFHATQSAS